MKGYDVIEALGETAEEYVQEAEERRELKGSRELRSSKHRAERTAGRKEKKRPGASGWKTGVLKAAAVCALLLVLPSATVLAMDYFSTLKGDELAFGRVEYRGDGIVAIQVQNYSDKVLEFQEDVKLGIFYANEEIPQTEGGSVKMEGNVIAPHSTSELIVDLSGAYNMEIADQPLTDDWYYLVLTNDHFVFGQDWQCMVDFQNVTEERVIYKAENGDEGEESGEKQERQKEQEGQGAGEYREMAMESFRYEDWAKPVENVNISVFFGIQRSGSFSDHINIAGSQGDEVFAVESGRIGETGFEAESGNYIVLFVQDEVNEIAVKYGHLEEVYVSEGQEVEKGAAIGTMGKTGRSAGPNLLLALYVNDKPVNPLGEESGMVSEVPEMYPAADLLREHSENTGTDSVPSGLMVPAFIAYNGAVYGSYDYDVSSDYLIVSDGPVEFNPSYTHTAYQIVGHPDLVAIIINDGYAVYRKVSDVVFSLGGVTYQVECPADYLGGDAAGELLGEKNGMKIYQALEDKKVMQGKCIVDISELMSQVLPEYFDGSEENHTDCRWVADVVE